MGKARIDLTGEQFGELTALRPGKDRQQSKLWWCSCSCGSEYEYYTHNLRGGLSTRCRECARSPSRSGRTPGVSHMSEWVVWKKVKKSGECCKRWLVFTQFLSDVGPRPSAKHSFRRVDQRQLFTPENARWMLPHEYKRPETGKFVTFNGKRQNLSAWARERGISPQALHQRIQRHGLERALARDFKRGGT